MHVEPFTIHDAVRILDHPDTPAAYVEWREFLPIVCAADRTNLGNVLGWSMERSRQPLGASWSIFEDVFQGAPDDLIEEWMASLGATPIEDFVDHHVPFMRNLAGMGAAQKPGRLMRAFLQEYRMPSEPDASTRALLDEAPSSVIIEITRSCNFACTMCSSRTGGFVPERTMTLPAFGELVRVLAPSAESLRVNGYGETTLVPQLPLYLDCLDEFGFRGRREIITNLSAAPHIYADLWDRGFVIMASWDAARAGLFEAIRVGASFDSMMDSLRRLGERARAEPERLVLLCTVQERNLHEMPGVVRVAADVGSGLVLFNMVNEEDGSPWMDDRFEEIRELFAVTDALATSLGVEIRLPDHVGRRRLRLPHTQRSSATFCDRPYREIVVAYDGEVTVCNMFNPFSYGTLIPPGPPRSVPDRMKRLWSGPNARVMRSLINSAAPHPYCTDCYFLHSPAAR